MKAASIRGKLLGAALCLTIQPWLLAHDLQTSAVLVDGFVVFQANYEGSEAVSFAAVSVHGPDDGNPHADAYQTGRTDAEGRFVFIPNRTGKWKVTVDDEVGHRGTQEVTITSLTEPATAAPAAPQSSGRSTTDRLVIGLSVIFGVVGLLMAFLQRRKGAVSA